MNLIQTFLNRNRTTDEDGEAIVKTQWFAGSVYVDADALIRSRSFQDQLDEVEKFEEAYKALRPATGWRGAWCFRTPSST